MKILYLLLSLTVLNAVYGIEFENCNSGSCETSECNTDSCVSECQSECQSVECQQGCYNSCSNYISSCGQCRSCENNCRSGCRTSSCNRKCSNSCSNNCNSCNQYRRQCNNNCKESSNKCKVTSSEQSDHSSNTNTNSNTNSNTTSISNPQVNVTTNLTITNDIVLTNRIDNPIHVNSTNINNISIKLQSNNTGSYPTINKDVELLATKAQNCCLVVPPKECKYDENKQINCTNNVYKTCSDNICRSPIVATHPIYIRVPYPVYQPVPYPVNRIQYIQKPYPVHVPHVVNNPVYIPVHKPIPYPVDKPVPYPVNVPQPIPVPIYKQVTIPQPYPQPIVYTKVVPQYVQQPCPVIPFGNNRMPVCNSFAESQQYIGTKQHFLVDQFAGQINAPVTSYCSRTNQFPYMNCNNVQLQQCGGCFNCNAGFNLNSCMNSSLCSLQCRQILGNVPSMNQQINKFLTCSTDAMGQTKCQ